MIYAVDERGCKIEAARGRKGLCPTCGESLRARCGEIRIWHWGHIGRPECDPWQEHESEWHRSWKRFVSPERSEVCMGEHRADMLTVDDCVVELQHSSISPLDVQIREAFYGKMIWLLDGTAFAGQIRVETIDGETRFTWAHPRRTWLAASRPIYIHGFTLGSHIRGVNPHTGRVERQWRPLTESSDILQILSLSKCGGVSGTGRVLSQERFVTRLFRDHAS